MGEKKNTISSGYDALRGLCLICDPYGSESEHVRSVFVPFQSRTYGSMCDCIAVSII